MSFVSLNSSRRFDRFLRLIAAAIVSFGVSGDIQAVDMKDAEAAAAAGYHEYAVVIAKDLAKNGSSKAALFLANAHLNSTGVEGDLNEAVKWFCRAEDGGVEEARHTLSLLRRKVFQSDPGDAVAGAIRAAFKNYREKEIVSDIEDLPAAADGDSLGARLFKAGHKGEALKTLLREARTLDPAAPIYLKVFYFNRVEGLPERDPRILELFEELAGEGHAGSREVVGRVLMEGVGADKNENKAMEMLADATSEESRKMLVKAYLDRGWEEKAAAVYRAAAAEGSAWGNYEYALLLIRDELPGDAITYLERTVAADPQHWPATIKLGKLLVEGRDGRGDPRRGFDLYKRAADVGDDAVSQYVVGLLYLRGVGGDPSKEKAIHYFAKAASRGIAQAREELDKLTASKKPQMAAQDSDVPMEFKPGSSSVGAKSKPPVKSAKTRPKARPKVHVVKEGDTFYGITLKYKISYRALRRANPGVNEAKLKLGQKIKLPAK